MAAPHPADIVNTAAGAASLLLEWPEPVPKPEIELPLYGSSEEPEIHPKAQESILGKRSREERDVTQATATRQTPGARPASRLAATAAPAAPATVLPMMLPPAASASASSDARIVEPAPRRPVAFRFKLSTTCGTCLYSRVSMDLNLLASTMGRSVQELQAEIQRGDAETTASGLRWQVTPARLGSETSYTTPLPVMKEMFHHEEATGMFSAQVMTAESSYVLYEQYGMSLKQVSLMLQSTAWRVQQLREFFAANAGPLIVEFGLIKIVVSKMPQLPPSAADVLLPEAIAAPVAPAAIVKCYYKVDVTRVSEFPTCLHVGSPSVVDMADMLGMSVKKLQKRLQGGTPARPFSLQSGGLKFTVSREPLGVDEPMMSESNRRVAYGSGFTYTLLCGQRTLYSAQYATLSRVASTMGWNSTDLKTELLKHNGRIFVTYGELMHTVVTEEEVLQEIKERAGAAVQGTVAEGSTAAVDPSATVPLATEFHSLLA